MRFPAPAAVASVWQYASAPASPPRLPPSPTGSLVTKKFIIGEGFSPRGYSPGLCTCASNTQDASETMQNNPRAEALILGMVSPRKSDSTVTREASAGNRSPARGDGLWRPLVIVNTPGP